MEWGKGHAKYVQEEPSRPLTGRRPEARDRVNLFYSETVISRVRGFSSPEGVVRGGNGRRPKERLDHLH